MSKVDLKGKTILVTGAAGFIGSNLVKRLYKDVEDVTVIGIDNGSVQHRRQGGQPSDRCRYCT